MVLIERADRVTGDAVSRLDLPCSIHAYRHSDTGDCGVSPGRDVDRQSLRQARTFRYMGMATTWDPSRCRFAQKCAERRKRLAEHLSRSVGYRGPFSIDGVATAEGFRPTELNPRMSMGFGIQCAEIDGLNIAMATWAQCEGDIDIDPVWLEQLVVSRPMNIGLCAPGSLSRTCVRTQNRGVPRRGSPGPVAGREPWKAGGWAGTGRELRIADARSVTSAGRSLVGAIAVSAAQLAASTWDLTLPDIEPATDVTSR